MTELQVWELVIAWVLPVLVGLLTKGSWPANWKAILLLALSAANGIAKGIVAAGGVALFDWKAALWSTGVTFAVGVAVHFGLYRPTGVTDWAQRSLVKDDFRLAG